jgi:hypothetical protein
MPRRRSRDEPPEIDYASGPVAIRPGDITYTRNGFDVGIGMHSYLFPFRDVVAVEAVEPWPCFEVEWRDAGGTSKKRFVPRFRSERDAVGRDVEKLFRYLERERRGDLAKRGWLDAPVVHWERVKGFPDEEERDDAAPGAYRRAARTAGETILARREEPSAFETLLDWLASSPDHPWRDHPRDVAVTDEHVYVRRRDETVHRLPLATLRGVRKNRDLDALYVFGRNTILLLPRRDGCPVLALLDARFEESAASG